MHIEKRALSRTQAPMGSRARILDAQPRGLGMIFGMGILFFTNFCMQVTVKYFDQLE